MVAALAEKIPISGSVFTLETLAARRAVLFVQELGLRNVVFEGDSESLRVIDFFHIPLVVILFTTFLCLQALFRAFFSPMCVGKLTL